MTLKFTDVCLLTGLGLVPWCCFFQNKEVVHAKEPWIVPITGFIAPWSNRGVIQVISSLEVLGVIAGIATGGVSETYYFPRYLPLVFLLVHQGSPMGGSDHPYPTGPTRINVFHKYYKPGVDLIH